MVIDKNLSILFALCYTVLVHQQLLHWYDQHHRQLPWRAPMGQTPNPYHVWISEIMLQQTTVGAVKGYFQKFITLWPTVEALANASLDEVLHAWQGLGYYARARNLHKCAQVVTQEYGGVFPTTSEELQKLPGIGPYTAAAIGAIAFQESIAVVDTNVERVISRMFAIEEPLPSSKPTIRSLTQSVTPEKRPGDFAQAMMDLGSGICLPVAPLCILCPLQANCQAHHKGTMELLPRRLPKPTRPTRHGTIYWITNDQGKVFIRQRPPQGLLGGLMEFPSTPWTESQEHLNPLFPDLNIVETLAKPVEHTFTHFHLVLQLVRAKAQTLDTEGIWVSPQDLPKYAFPTLMKKVMKAVL